MDPERAKDGPFGAPIAHGFLTLSLIIPFWGELFDVEGVTTKVNYGLDKVRFTSPVKVCSRIRMRATIAEVTEVKGGAQIKVANTIEIEGQERPAVVAEFLARFHADAEAIYSYEGTHEINALIVGRALTGESAFTR